MKVIQLKRTGNISRLLISVKTEIITDTKYIIIDDTPIEVKPEEIVLELTNGKLTPTLFIDDNYEIISISKIYPARVYT